MKHLVVRLGVSLTSRLTAAQISCLDPAKKPTNEDVVEKLKR